MKEFDRNKKIVILNSHPKINSDSYNELRESVWLERVNSMKKNNKPIWNGAIYYLDSFEEIGGETKLTLSLCEYKDIVLKEIKPNTENVLSNKSFACVQCLILDKENKILFGVGELDQLILVGGTLRREDFDISSFSNIDQYVMKEIEIETNLGIYPSSPSLLSIIENQGILTFLFVYKVDTNFIEGVDYLKRGEFHSEYVVPKENILEKVSRFNERLMSIKFYLENNFL